MSERVVVGDLSEIIVAGIGVAAVAIGGSRRERLLIVALDELRAGVKKQREDPVGMRAKRTEVPECVETVVSAASRVLNRRLESEPVAVDAAEKGERRHVRHVTPYSWQVKQAL